MSCFNKVELLKSHSVFFFLFPSALRWSASAWKKVIRAPPAAQILLPRPQPTVKWASWHLCRPRHHLFRTPRSSPTSELSPPPSPSTPTTKSSTRLHPLKVKHLLIGHVSAVSSSSLWLVTTVLHSLLVGTYMLWESDFRSVLDKESRKTTIMATSWLR